MCGIVGYIGTKEATPIILSALRRLEYRGYDSAGIAGINENGKTHLEIRRCEGSIEHLQKLVQSRPLSGSVGIGHTRWATHGRPSERNAHPHRYKEVVIVHNGIIENYREIKSDLEKKGHRFESETDSEVIAHLLQKNLDETNDFEKSCFALVRSLKGAFAIAAIWTQHPQCIFVAKQHSPILLGKGSGENFIASDIPALLEFTHDFLILNDKEMAFVGPDHMKIMSFEGKEVKKKIQKIEWSLAMAEKEGFDHFMLKEIFEQPRVIQDGLRGYVKSGFRDVDFEGVSWTKSQWKSFQHVNILACGSAWHAGLIGKHLLENVARVHAEVDLASEFRYRNPVLPPKTLSIAVSQSGETADTLAAIDEARKKKSQLLSITNTVESSISRKTKNVIYTHAGPEISVASTKCFTAQLVAFCLLSLKLAAERKVRPQTYLNQFLKDLSKLPQQVEQVLALNDTIKEIVDDYVSFDKYFYLGRGISYPIALEGALKLKEIAYINTQAYPAGEMKHGPIALISPEWPVICIAPKDKILPKMLSNMEVVKARGGKIISITTEGQEEVKALSDVTLEVPLVREELSPILTNVCLQMLAYHMSVKRGCNVDKPRNLAKSVTVE